MTRPHGSTIHAYENGSVYIQGVDYGGRMSVIERNNECIVIRVDGHKRWAGVGSERVYEPPRLLVYAIESEHGTEAALSTTLRVRPLVEISLARGARR